MDSVNLPEGWCLTNLGNVLELKYGKSLPASKRDDGKFPVYGSNGIIGGHSEPLVKTEGIIVGRKGSYGEVQLSNSPFFPIDTTYYVDDLFSQPFKYWFYQLKMLPLTELNRSTAIPGLNREDAYSQYIALPPLAEQKIIADKLDTLLAQVDVARARLESIPEILKNFRQSVLIAAVSGKLLSCNSGYCSIEVRENWAHEIVGLNHWKEYKFSEAIKITGGSQPPKSEFSNKEKEGYIRLIQIRDYKSESYKVYIPLEKAKRFVSKDDVMIGRYGPPIFQILRGLEGAYNVALMKAEPDTKILDREYLYWYLQNYKLFNYIDAGSDRTAGQTGVNKKYLESYPILVPPLNEQIEIVRRIEELFSFADCIEQQANTALERLNNLNQSILTKALRGELTVEWRENNPMLISGENSAEALLATIKAKRELIEKRPKPKRITVKKKTGNHMSKQIINVVEALKHAGKPLSGQQLLEACGYPNDSTTDQLEQFFLDIRDAIAIEKSIVKLERDVNSQDWFALAKDSQL